MGIQVFSRGWLGSACLPRARGFGVEVDPEAQRPEGQERSDQPEAMGGVGVLGQPIHQ